VDGSAAILVGEIDRLFGLRAVAIAAEAAAEMAQVEIDVLFRNAGDPGLVRDRKKPLESVRRFSKCRARL
jgi:hypothetical protein